MTLGSAYIEPFIRGDWGNIRGGNVLGEFPDNHITLVAV